MSQKLQTLPSSEAANKTVLVRADLNVPMSDGVVTDVTRIERFVPTVKALREAGARVLIATHLGRPKGQIVQALSTTKIMSAVTTALGEQVGHADLTIKAVSDALGSNGVVLLENLRFHPGEETNDATFAANLASLADLFVNDAFSCAHRAHASTDAITRLLPSFAGPSLVAEVDALTRCLDVPERPVAALVGGAKVSTKIGVLRFLLPKVDHLIIGGGMANTFIAADGHPVGKSLHEPDALEIARSVMGEAAKAGCSLLLPSDLVVAKEFAAHAEHDTVTASRIPEDSMALDVGEQTIERINETLEQCKTVLWNGPLGAFEIEPFDRATIACAQKAAALTQSGRLTSVAGGGDTVAALNQAQAAEHFTYVSTAGGAFLEWIEGKELPGIAALTKSAIHERVE